MRIDRPDDGDADTPRPPVPGAGAGQLFEVQFHTQASLDAKEETRAAYERLRTLPPDHAEVRLCIRRSVTGSGP